MFIGNPYEPNGNPSVIRNGFNFTPANRLTIPQQWSLRVPDRTAIKLSEIAPDIGGTHLLTMHRDVYNVWQWTNPDVNSAQKAFIWRSISKPDFGIDGRYTNRAGYEEARYCWELTFNYNLNWLKFNYEPGLPVYEVVPISRQGFGDDGGRDYWCLTVRAAEPNVAGPLERTWQFYYYPGLATFLNPRNQVSLREGQPTPFRLGDMWQFYGPSDFTAGDPYAPAFQHGDGATLFERLNRPYFPETIPETVYLTPLVM